MTTCRLLRALRERHVLRYERRTGWAHPNRAKLAKVDVINHDDGYSVECISCTCTWTEFVRSQVDAATIATIHVQLTNHTVCIERLGWIQYSPAEVTA